MINVVVYIHLHEEVFLRSTGNFCPPWSGSLVVCFFCCTYFFQFTFFSYMLYCLIKRFQQSWLLKGVCAGWPQQVRKLTCTTLMWWLPCTAFGNFFHYFKCAGNNYVCVCFKQLEQIVRLFSKAHQSGCIMSSLIRSQSTDCWPFSVSEFSQQSPRRQHCSAYNTHHDPPW